MFVFVVCLRQSPEPPGVFWQLTKLAALDSGPRAWSVANNPRILLKDSKNGFKTWVGTLRRLAAGSHATGIPPESSRHGPCLPVHSMPKGAICSCPSAFVTGFSSGPGMVDASQKAQTASEFRRSHEYSNGHSGTERRGTLHIALSHVEFQTPEGTVRARSRIRFGLLCSASSMSLER